MVIKKSALFLLFPLLLGVFCCRAEALDDGTFQHPLYIGATGGYGSTTWAGLVPAEENQNLAISLSTPIEVKEGGGVWGFFAGYEWTPYFALEAAYMRYPDAHVTFDPISLFSFINEGLDGFTTRTETVSAMAKIMLLIPNTHMRLYSSLGVAGVHREDMLKDRWRSSPTFGAGFNYHFAEHFMAEIGGNYTAGYGESQLNPTDVYFPFLYSGFVRLAYCF